MTSAVNAMKEPEVSCPHLSEIEFTDDDCCNSFLQLSVKFGDLPVLALLDSGSSINLMSKALYMAIPGNMKHQVNMDNLPTSLTANSQTTQVDRAVRIKIQLPQRKHSILVYVLNETSHPLILGTNYLTSKGIVLNFGKQSIQFTKGKARLKQKMIVPPETESFLWTKAIGIPIGTQVMVTAHAKVYKLGIVVARSVGTVTASRSVAVKLLNPGKEQVLLPRNTFVATLTVLDSSHTVSASLLTMLVANHLQNVTRLCRLANQTLMN